jgi:DNA-binding transcriptional regulator GbsR (MarR family)
MNYTEARQEFIQVWGALGSNWGINKAMAQIHALLLATDVPLTTDEIMEELQVSRSNANLNIRALLDWGLIYKKHIPGDRKEYFIAEKDIWEVAIKIMKERRRKEVDPVISELKTIGNFEAKTEEEQHFKSLLKDINDLSGKLISLGDFLEKADKFKFFKWALKGF